VGADFPLVQRSGKAMRSCMANMASYLSTLKRPGTSCIPGSCSCRARIAFLSTFLSTMNQLHFLFRSVEDDPTRSRAVICHPIDEVVTSQRVLAATTCDQLTGIATESIRTTIAAQRGPARSDEGAWRPQGRILKQRGMLPSL